MTGWFAGLLLGDCHCDCDCGPSLEGYSIFSVLNSEDSFSTFVVYYTGESLKGFEYIHNQHNVRT